MRENCTCWSGPCIHSKYPLKIPPRVVRRFWTGTLNNMTYSVIWRHGNPSWSKNKIISGHKVPLAPFQKNPDGQVQLQHETEQGQYHNQHSKHSLGPLLGENWEIFPSYLILFPTITHKRGHWTLMLQPLRRI